MSSILLGSKLRRKLLAYSFAHPDESFYVRELAEAISVNAGNLSRELKKLEKEGLYKSLLKGKTKYYHLYKHYPFYNELKKIISKTDGAEGLIKKIVSKNNNILIAFLYGSYVNDMLNKTSDIDLVIVGDINYENLVNDVKKVEAIIDREINFSIYDLGEFEKERKKIGGFLNLVLGENIILLKGKINNE